MKILKQKDIKKLRDKWLKEELIDVITLVPIERSTLDHDHVDGYCRAVLDYNSNQFLGKVESAWKRFGYKFNRKYLPRVLRNIAAYLETDYSTNPIHPKHISTLVKRFNRYNSERQIRILHGMSTNKIGKTKSERNLQYKKALWKKENIYQV